MAQSGKISFQKDVNFCSKRFNRPFLVRILRSGNRENTGRWETAPLRRRGTSVVLVRLARLSQSVVVLLVNAQRPVFSDLDFTLHQNRDRLASHTILESQTKAEREMLFVHLGRADV